MQAAASESLEMQPVFKSRQVQLKKKEQTWPVYLVRKMESQGSDNFPIHQNVSAETGSSRKPTWMLGLQAQGCPSEVAVASQEKDKKRHQLLVWEKSQELPKTDWLVVSFGLAEIIGVLCWLP